MDPEDFRPTAPLAESRVEAPNCFRSFALILVGLAAFVGAVLFERYGPWSKDDFGKRPGDDARRQVHKEFVALAAVGDILQGDRPPEGEALQGFLLEVEWEGGNLLVTAREPGEDPYPATPWVRVD